MKYFRRCIYFSITLTLILNVFVNAMPGNSGYEGGISSGYLIGRTFSDYKEVVFLTGEPIVFTGSATVKKTLKTNDDEDILSTVYTYSLKNTQLSGTLTRAVTLETTINKKEDGQKTEKTKIVGKPQETIRIGGEQYTIDTYEFSKANVIDERAAVNYFAGNQWGRKTYKYRNATSSKTGKIILETTGNFFGYNQCWSTTETISLKHSIKADLLNNDVKDTWGGTAKVNLSLTTKKEIEYFKNEPDIISFEGGYVQKEKNEGILEYVSNLPEFDQDGFSTYNILEKNDSLSIETFPSITRLPLVKLGYLKGHWCENDTKILYSLGVLKDNDNKFNPEQYIKRSEFVSAVVLAAKEVPLDPVYISKNKKKKEEKELISPFKDVLTTDYYFESINNAYKRGLVRGTGDNTFAPNIHITTAESLTVLIKALGLEMLPKWPDEVTTFRDNDQIPNWARNSIAAAERIGLVKGDEKRNIHPNTYLTKARAAIIINKLIEYMRNDLMKDYSNKMINYGH